MSSRSKLHEIIAQRVTSKVLGDIDQPLEPTGLEREEIDAWLAAAGNAPFHYQAERLHREKLTSQVPWRMYKLDANACRELLSELKISAPEAGKILNMLAACDALVLATWTPDQCDDDHLMFEGTERNMEHIAAASAAVQNLILLATEAGYRTYWSSGGVLRTPAVFERFDIPLCEILLGAIFIYPDDVGSSEIKEGKLKDARGELEDWSRWVSASS